MDARGRAQLTRPHKTLAGAWDASRWCAFLVAAWCTPLAAASPPRVGQGPGGAGSLRPHALDPRDAAGEVEFLAPSPALVRREAPGRAGVPGESGGVGVGDEGSAGRAGPGQTQGPAILTGRQSLAERGPEPVLEQRRWAPPGGGRRIWIPPDIYGATGMHPRRWWPPSFHGSVRTVYTPQTQDARPKPKRQSTCHPPPLGNSRDDLQSYLSCIGDRCQNGDDSYIARAFKYSGCPSLVHHYPCNASLAEVGSSLETALVGHLCGGSCPDMCPKSELHRARD
mmetsp:Transcript_572/g.1844  ORF Transcript_572/g.1844 Transcript_572/m.1844 type:complete len:282 (-) Transcript_572:60-905(-)